MISSNKQTWQPIELCWRHKYVVIKFMSAITFVYQTISCQMSDAVSQDYSTSLVNCAHTSALVCYLSISLLITRQSRVRRSVLSRHTRNQWKVVARETELTLCSGACMDTCTGEVKWYTVWRSAKSRIYWLKVGLHIWHVFVWTYWTVKGKYHTLVHCVGENLILFPWHLTFMPWLVTFHE